MEDSTNRWFVEYWQEMYDMRADFNQVVYAKTKEEAEALIKDEHPRATHISAQQLKI